MQSSEVTNKCNPTCLSDTCASCSPLATIMTCFLIMLECLCSTQENQAYCTDHFAVMQGIMLVYIHSRMVILNVSGECKNGGNYKLTMTSNSYHLACVTPEHHPQLNQPIFFSVQHISKDHRLLHTRKLRSTLIMMPDVIHMMYRRAQGRELDPC